jgi:hypothetical protein|nr:MAG TPA: hypothetical protein [Caudoviricetes sp.]
MYDYGYYDNIDVDIDVDELAEREYLQEIKENTLLSLDLHTEDEWFLDEM